MERITVNTGGSVSEISVGEKWEEVDSLLPPGNTVIITDDNVLALYGPGFPSLPVISIKPGEQSKNLETAGDISLRLLEKGLDRSGFILAIGGGVVCDIAGFVGSIYMRGIRFGYVSTTLLSQVDASTGGKNGVDHGGAKNILGVIRQPDFVICDPEMLLTLPDEEYLSGLAELIKTAVIGDSQLFSLLEKHRDDVFRRDPALMGMLIGRAVRFKASVVSEDEREHGLRRVLNFGHTFGHAIEMHQAVRHGIAVASGMHLAAMLSLEKGFISDNEAARIRGLLRMYGLNLITGVDPPEMEMLIRRDKKKTGNDIYFVFSNGIGSASCNKVSLSEIIDFYTRFRVKNTKS